MRLHLQEQLLYKSTDLANNYPFVFHDGHICISAINPIAVFENFEDLEDFLISHPKVKSNPNAGIAGYITFEGEMEFGIYSGFLNYQIELEENTDLTSKIIYPSKKQYIESIKECQNYIKEGDIYQANLSHKFIINKNKLNFIAIYKKLCKLNPANHAAFLDFKNHSIISSSPETFWRLKNGEICTSPIKGTGNILKELINSDKEKAEHLMIVDLMRNDLGKISKNIEVKNFLKVQELNNLYHLVSDIKGELDKQKSFVQIFKALHPGGSISGAPKARAINIIKELEKFPRGPYTGAFGYYKFNQEACFAITIRSIIFDKVREELSLHTGAGITAYSDPEREYLETLLKAEKLLAVFNI